MRTRLRLLVLVATAATACKPDAASEASLDGGARPMLAVPLEAAASTSTGRSTQAAGASWHGSYRSEAGTLYIPPDWKGVRWNVADASSGVGEGTIRLTLDPAGRVGGVIEGPLGPAMVTGFGADGGLTASIRPERAEDRGFAGTLVGRVVDGRIEGTMQVSGALADAVRVATFALGADDVQGR